MSAFAVALRHPKLLTTTPRMSDNLLNPLRFDDGARYQHPLFG